MAAPFCALTKEMTQNVGKKLFMAKSLFHSFLKHIFFLLVLHLSLFCVTILNMIIPNGENYIGKTQHSRLLPYIGR